MKCFVLYYYYASLTSFHKGMQMAQLKLVCSEKQNCVLTCLVTS